MSDWQSIETAPKDGTMILIYEADIGWIYHSCWCKNSGIEWWGGTGLHQNFTHWMPLPKPPKQ